MSTVYWVLTILAAILAIVEFVSDKKEVVGSGTEYVVFIGLPIIFALGKLIFGGSDLSGIGFVLIIIYGFLLIGLFALVSAKNKEIDDLTKDKKIEQNKKNNKDK